MKQGFFKQFLFSITALVTGDELGSIHLIGEYLQLIAWTVGIIAGLVSAVNGIDSLLRKWSKNGNNKTDIKTEG